MSGPSQKIRHPRELLPTIGINISIVANDSALFKGFE